jgi:hypothetical protein
LRETESIVEASVEAGKPYIPALKRPAVKSAGIAAFLSLFVKTKRKPRRAVAEFGRPSWVSPPLHLLRSYCRTSLRARRCTRAFDLGNGADGLPGVRIFRLQRAPATASEHGFRHAP